MFNCHTLTQLLHKSLLYSSLAKIYTMNGHGQLTKFLTQPHLVLSTLLIAKKTGWLCWKRKIEPQGFRLQLSQWQVARLRLLMQGTSCTGIVPSSSQDSFSLASYRLNSTGILFNYHLQSHQNLLRTSSRSQVGDAIKCSSAKLLVLRETVKGFCSQKCSAVTYKQGFIVYTVYN